MLRRTFRKFDVDNCGRITVASAGSYMWACHIISPKLMVTISQSDPTANQLETPNVFDLDPLFEKVGLIVKITCFYVSWEDLGGGVGCSTGGMGFP